MRKAEKQFFGSRILFLIKRLFLRIFRDKVIKRQILIKIIVFVIFVTRYSVLPLISLTRFQESLKGQNLVVFSKTQIAESRLINVNTKTQFRKKKNFTAKRPPPGPDWKGITAHYSL